MDPFVLSRNAFDLYCSEYLNNNEQLNFNLNHISIKNNDYEKAIHTLNERYEYFLQTLDRLRLSIEQTTRNHNINSLNSREIDTLTLSSITNSKRSNRKRMHKSSKRRMPKVCITVSCPEHRTQQQPNIKMK